MNVRIANGNTDANHRVVRVLIMAFFAPIEPLLRRARLKGFRTYLPMHSIGNLALENACGNGVLHGNGNAELFEVSILAAGHRGLDRSAQPRLTGLDGLRQDGQKDAGAAAGINDYGRDPMRSHQLPAFPDRTGRDCR